MSTALLAPPAAKPMAVQRDGVGLEDALYEIVQGVKVELPPMGALSTRIMGRFNTRLDTFAESRRLGIVVPEMLFILDAQRDLRRRPDVAFVTAERWALDRPMPATGDWDVVPDLAVEVVSPHDTMEAVVAKMREYFRCGVRAVWIVLPFEAEVYLYDAPNRNRILTRDETLDGSPLLPGFLLPLAELFPPRDAAETPSVPNDE